MADPGEDGISNARWESSIVSLFNSKLFSDCVVKAGNTAWNSHRVVLCTKSQFFMKALTASGGHDDAHEAAHMQEVVLPQGHDPVHIGWALQFLYTGNLNHVTHMVKGSRELLVEDQSDELHSYKAFLGLYQVGSLFVCQSLCDAVIKAFDTNNMMRAQSLQIWQAGEGNSFELLDPIFIEAFVSCAKTAYGLDDGGDEDENYNTSPICKPFVQLFEFTRYMLFTNTDLVLRLSEVPALQTDLIIALRNFEDVGNDYVYQLPDKCRGCGLQALDPVSRKPVPGGKAYINFWLRKNLCFHCGRHSAYCCPSDY